MKRFDLHPKPATSVRQRSVLGGVLTLCSIALVLVFALLLSQIDLFETNEWIVMDDAGAGDLDVKFDISFFQVTYCAEVTINVLDALGRGEKANSKVTSAEFMKSSPLSKVGECRIVGTLRAPAGGKGTFRLLPKHGLPGDRSHAFGNMHTIHSLSFGQDIYHGKPLTVLLVDDDSTHAQTSSGYWTYFLNLVPTTSNGQLGYQVAATRSFHQAAFNPMQPNDVVGSIYFVYEASALRMVIDSRPGIMSLLHFMARVLGVVGGVFALVAATRELLNRLLVRQIKTVL
ncbi:hypothetical protein BASA82_000832 [Batrachochytrium salamandrivorans]|nr:hypothetical protein BASA81_004520 [Batrachochytrium salamandrivorans]KAH9262104.1 hypothetical protein BASA82_000832 [Batrachochytrium salamandrivorans]